MGPIAATFMFQGDLHVVTYDGDIFRVVTKGSPNPWDWHFELVTKLR